MSNGEDKKNVLLLILKVLMEKTNRTEMLTEREIEEILEEEYEISIERKQFYRCIDKLIEAQYPIKKIKGSSARYYYDGIMFRTTDIIYLSHLINKATDISCKEKENLMQRLETNPFTEDRWSCNPFINMNLEVTNIDQLPMNIEYWPLDNFYSIYNAFKGKYKIQYKIYRNNVVSEQFVSYVDDIVLKEEKIRISINNSLFYINEIINVKILK